jgi:hypothetical protein
MFEPEYANSIAALEYFRDAHDHEREARLAGTVLWVEWSWSPREGRRWLGDILSFEDVPPAVRARALWAASRIARNHGDYALDVELNEELLSLWRSLLFRESLRTREHAKFLWSIDSDLAGLAGVATARGQPAVAVVLLGAAEATREVSGTGQEPFEAGLQAQTEAAVRRSLDVDALQAALSEGRAMTVEAAAAYAFAYVDRTV